MSARQYDDGKHARTNKNEYRQRNVTMPFLILAATILLCPYKHIHMRTWAKMSVRACNCLCLWPTNGTHDCCALSLNNFACTCTSSRILPEEWNTWNEAKKKGIKQLTACLVETNECAEKEKKMTSKSEWNLKRRHCQCIELN